MPNGCFLKNNTTHTHIIHNIHIKGLTQGYKK